MTLYTVRSIYFFLSNLDTLLNGFPLLKPRSLNMQAKHFCGIPVLLLKSGVYRLLYNLTYVFMQHKVCCGIIQIKHFIRVSV